MDSQIVPGGFLMKYYAARHTLGHYRSFGGTGSYTFPSSVLASPTHFTQLLQYAFSKTISRHPTLAFGVIPQSKDVEAHFYLQTSINFQDVVSFHPSSAPAGQEDEVLEKELGLAHRHMWVDQTQKPGWKIIVVNHENDEGRVDIIFITHHALADGGSGAAFHKTLYSYLSEGLSLPSPTSQWPHQVSQTTKLPLAIEDAFPFPSTATLPVPTPASDPEDPTTQPPWAALPPTFPIKDLALLLSIPPEPLTKTLQFCKRTKITLTSLLHSLILLHLSHSLPDQLPSIKTATPYSLRRFSSFPDDEMLNHISSISTHFPATLITHLRTLAEGSEGEKEAMQKIGFIFQSQIASEMEFIEKEGYSSPLLAQQGVANSLSSVQAIQEYHAAVLKAKREYAYEISNIGLVKLPTKQEYSTLGKEGNIKLQSLIFSQCAMPFGAAIGCSVVSLADGPLTICFSYQEGVVSEEFMRGLRDYVGRRLRGFGA